MNQAPKKEIGRTSVRSAIILSGVIFLAVVLALASFVRWQEDELTQLSRSLYDRGFVGVNYIHKAHTGFVYFIASRATATTPELTAQETAALGVVLDDMDVAVERAMTPGSRARAKAARREISALLQQPSPDLSPAALHKIDQNIAKVVRRYAADGLELRTNVDTVVTKLTRLFAGAIAIAAVVSMLILYFVLRAEFTERKRSEQILRDSEERFRAIYEKAPVGIGLVGPDHDFLSVNPKLADMLGYTQRDLAGLGPADITYPDDATVTTESLKRLFERDSGSYAMEKRYRRKDGAVIWVSLTVSAVLDETGRPSSTIGVVEDITEQKKTNEALRRSETSLADAQRIAHVGSWEHDLSTGAVIWSDEMYRIFGFDRQRFGGTYGDFFACVHPDDRQIVETATARAIADGENYDIYFRIQRPDGEQRIVHSQAETRFDETGRAVRRSGTVQDVTERRRAEEALARSEELLQQVIRVSDIGIFDHDHRTNNIYWSLKLRKIYGWDPDEPVTLEKILDQIHPDDAEKIAATIRHAHDPSGDGIFDVEHKIVRRDGETRWLIVRGHTYFEGDGQSRHPLRTVGGTLDITERKRSQEKLEQAQKMETVGRLAGGIAHDLNNQLMIVQGNVELLRERTSDVAENQRIADCALHATEGSAKLVQELLAYSRRQFLQPQAVDVGALIARVKDLLKSLVTEKIAIETSVPNDLWQAFVDAMQLENAIVNLLLNARDAMPDGGTLSITAENVAALPDRLKTYAGTVSGPFVRIGMTDTGVGMAPETLRRAFEPFFTTKGVGKGSGLGLSMVYGFVRQSGGFIDIDSAPGRGTRVDLYLRRAESEAAAGASHYEKQALGTGETVLVVEDNADVRGIVVTFLREFGYHIIAAEDGPAALKVLESNQPIDLLFTDIVMPGGMSGVELARRAQELRPAIKLLFATGHAKDAVGTITAVEFGGDVLAKPYRKQDLSRAVCNVLKTPEETPADPSLTEPADS